MNEGQQRLPDSKQEQGLKPSQPSPLVIPTNAGTPIGPRDPVTKNDKAK